MMKTKLFLALTLVAVATTITALAQYTGPYGLANDDAIAPATTNTYYKTCEEFANLPLAISLKADGASTAFVPVLAYRSLNSTVYETTPYFAVWLQLNGTTPVVTLTNLNVGGAAVIKFLVGNTNASGVIVTNKMTVNFKAPKKGVFPISR